MSRNAESFRLRDYKTSFTCLVGVPLNDYAHIVAVFKWFIHFDIEALRIVETGVKRICN